MKKLAMTLGAAALTFCLTMAAVGFAIAQDRLPAMNPDPAQAGADPSMAKPEGSTVPILTAPPVENPESTTGLAPADQPVNNAKPNVAGQVVPSSRETAAHSDSIYQHDRQPVLTHTFNFTAAQKQAIADALATNQAIAMNASDAVGLEIAETVVLPDTVKLNPLPESLVSQMPSLNAYRYVKIGQKIVLVDANLRYVAAVIE